MLFDSIDFAIFLPIVFAIYWSIRHCGLKIQNAFLIVASYVFYGWWDWRFLSLIILSSTVDYVLAQKVFDSSSKQRSKHYLYISILINLGVLAVFKYYNFFIDNIEELFTLLGSHHVFARLDWVLPVGISFYTFQTMSYTIDVYRGKLQPSRDPFSFFAYVSFFPQLVAGPIERATNFLPQFRKRRTFDYPQAIDGLRQILWGFFKKMVIADNCAFYVDMFFADPTAYSGSALLLGAVLFTFQIYCDFSGYSDIAIGLGRLFGFNLRQNFAFPYFSRDIAEFWRRWHISLSSWFRDYVYIPLGGSRRGQWITIRNIFIVFIICGFWHGANWTYIVWGLLNSALYIPLYMLNRNRRNLNTIAEDKSAPFVYDFLSLGLTFILTIFLWIVFRSSSVEIAWIYICGIFDSSLFSVPHFEYKSNVLVIAVFIIFTMGMEWYSRLDRYGLERVGLNWQRWKRWSLYSFILFTIGMYSATNETPFIYFQF